MNIQDIEFRDKSVVMRVDFNVPQKNGEIQDDNRIRKVIPTINHIISNGGKLTLLSHLGRPGRNKDSIGRLPRKKYSLKRIAEHLDSLLETDVKFCDDTIGSKAEKAVKKLQSGEVLLLENTRFYDEEREGDESFAEAMSKHGEIFINDAFGTAHREHASTAVIAQFFDEDHKAFGFLMEKELEMADKVLNSEERPKTAIIGGAKVSDKISLINALLDKVDSVLIGGGMAYTFIKSFGGKIGDSLVDVNKLALAKQIFHSARDKKVRIMLPQDSIIAKEIDSDTEVKEAASKSIPEGWKGLDIGPKSIEHFTEIITESYTIIWNGPMGVFEEEAFANGTYSIAKAVGKATQENGAFSLIGGGDSVSAIKSLGMEDKVSYISTGGGAMLKYLEGVSLPGITAITET